MSNQSRSLSQADMCGIPFLDCGRDDFASSYMFAIGDFSVLALLGSDSAVGESITLMLGTAPVMTAVTIESVLVVQERRVSSNSARKCVNHRGCSRESARTWDSRDADVCGSGVRYSSSGCWQFVLVSLVYIMAVEIKRNTKYVEEANNVHESITGRVAAPPGDSRSWLTG